MNFIQAARTTVQEKVQAHYPLPSCLHTALELLSHAHIYYRCYKYDRICRVHRSSQGHPAVYGAALQLLSDSHSFFSHAVTIALVIKCAEDLLQEYRRLSESYQNLCQAVQWQYPIYSSIEWKAESRVLFRSLSPSLFIAYQIHVNGLIQQFKKIMSYTLHLFRQMFQMSMCLCDFYLLFQYDFRMRYEACTELVASWDHYRNQLQEDGKRLLEEIEKKCYLADPILKRLGVANNSVHFIHQLKQKIEGLAQKILLPSYHVAEETLDTLYIKGKITPFHINFAAGRAAIPALPYGRFPPWRGQKSAADPSLSSLRWFKNCF